MAEPQLTILAVGATGSVGRHVVEEALRGGHRVRALVRDANHVGRFPHAAEVVVGDLTRAETLAQAVTPSAYPSHHCGPERTVAGPSHAMRVPTRPMWAEQSG